MGDKSACDDGIGFIVSLRRYARRGIMLYISGANSIYVLDKSRVR